MADQSILCRGCGKTVSISDKDLDSEWKEAKESYPKDNVTRADALNMISFCPKCAGLSDETTLHTIKVK